jgi:hypothetical protein
VNSSFTSFSYAQNRVSAARQWQRAQKKTRAHAPLANLGVEMIAAIEEVHQIVESECAPLIAWVDLVELPPYEERCFRRFHNSKLLGHLVTPPRIIWLLHAIPSPPERVLLTKQSQR